MLVLVSRAFLSSEFTVGDVLPRLYGAAESGARITWIALDESGVAESELGRIQSIHLEPPLALVEDPARYLREIAGKIRRLVLPPDEKQA